MSELATANATATRTFVAYRIVSRLYFHLSILFVLLLRYGHSVLGVTVLLAAYGIALSVLTPAVPAVVRRFGAGPALTAGELLKAAGLLVLAAAPASFVVAGAGQVLNAAGFALAMSADAASVSRLGSPATVRALQASTQSLMFMALLGAGVAGGLLYLVDPRLPLLAGAGAAAGAAVLADLLRRRLPGPASSGLPTGPSGARATQPGLEPTSSGPTSAATEERSRGGKAASSGLQARPSGARATQPGLEPTSSGPTSAATEERSRGGKAASSGLQARPSGARATQPGLEPTSSGPTSAATEERSRGGKAASSGLQARPSGARATQQRQMSGSELRWANYYVLTRGFMLGVFVGGVPYLVFGVLHASVVVLTLVLAAYTLAAFVAARYVAGVLARTGTRVFAAGTALVLLAALLTFAAGRSVVAVLVAMVLLGAASGGVRPATMAGLSGAAATVRGGGIPPWLLSRMEALFGIANAAVVLVSGVVTYYWSIRTAMVALAAGFAVLFVASEAVARGRHDRRTPTS